MNHLTAGSPIQLYTDSSPNGFKITIALEELGLPYTLHHVRIDQGAQREPDFLRLNPHGRIPVLVDAAAGITLFESAAILLYLAEKTGQLLPSAPQARWQALQWLVFHAASVGPLIGQRVHFELFAAHPNAEAIERYRRLTDEAFATLDQHLAGHRFLAGDAFSIADIAHFGWTHIARIIDFDFSHHRHLSAWHERVAARPAVRKGVTLPAPATGDRRMKAMTSIASPAGASYPAFSAHPGYRRMFAPDQLTMGIFLPLRFYAGDMRVLAGQADLVAEIDRQGFAAVWVRDVPLFDPAFGDAGQVFDAFTYLAFLAARTQRLALATGSAIFSLRHPIDLAKASATIDQLSGGRLVLGIASGDRPAEFPAYGIEHSERGARFAQSVGDFRDLLRADSPAIDSPLGRIDAAALLPKPVNRAIPLVVTSSSGQSLDWIAAQADGWLTYPEATHVPQGPLRLAQKIAAWRALIPDGGFRPHMTNEWLDLVDDPDHPRTPLRGGFVLRTGRKGLIALLEEWQRAGVNHAALGIQFSQRPAAEVIQELAEEVLPRFPSHAGPPALAPLW